MIIFFQVPQFEKSHCKPLNAKSCMMEYTVFVICLCRGNTTECEFSKAL